MQANTITTLGKTGIPMTASLAVQTYYFLEINLKMEKKCFPVIIGDRRLGYDSQPSKEIRFFVHTFKYYVPRVRLYVLAEVSFSLFFFTEGYFVL